jgi:hypothetical protein
LLLFLLAVIVFSLRSDQLTFEPYFSRCHSLRGWQYILGTTYQHPGCLILKEFPLLLLANAGFAMVVDATTIATVAIASTAKVIVVVFVFILLYPFT